MPAVIEQEVVFPGVSAAELFSIYVTPERHSAAIQGDARISAEIGSPFTAFGENGLSPAEGRRDPSRPCQRPRPSS
jgi:hypothetical protein